MRLTYCCTVAGLFCDLSHSDAVIKIHMQMLLSAMM